MENVSQGIMVLYILDNIRQGSDRLKGHSGQGIEGGGMAKFLFREPENHNRSRSQPVWYHLTCVRDKSLGLIDIQDIEPSGAENVVDYFHLDGILHIGIAAAHLGQSRLSDIILRWAEASGGNNYIADSQLILEVSDYLATVIPDGESPADLYSDLLKGARDRR